MTNMAANLFEEIRKFNPYHGSDGRFTSAGAATSFTVRTKDSSKQWMVGNAKKKERSRIRTESVRSVEDRIRHQNYESAAIIDENGREIIFKDGEKNCVAFTQEETARMKGRTLTHNHPNSGFFSKEDIGVLVGADLAEMRATTREGRTFCLSRGEQYTDDNGAAFYNEFLKRFGDSQMRAQKSLDDRGYKEKIRSGFISQESANRDFTELIAKYMTEWAEKEADRYHLRFKVEERKTA